MYTLHTFSSTDASSAEFLAKGFDVMQPLRTLGGEVVDIITTNGPGPAPVIGLIFPGRIYGHQIRNGAGKLHRWNHEGKSYDASCSVPRQLDLARNIQRGFDWNRPYQTKSGLTATILTDMRIGSRNIVVLVGGKQAIYYYPNGTTHSEGKETGFDLINN